MNHFIEKYLAAAIERVCGSYITTAAGVIGIAASVAAQSTALVPVAYQADVTLAGVILAGVAAILAKDKDTPTPPPLVIEH